MNTSVAGHLYLAGPEVFLPEQERLAILAQKRAVLRDLRLVGLDPMDNNLDLSAAATPFEQGLSIYRANIAMMRKADGALINLSPFRGPSADAGTLFEVGFLTGIAKPVIGYTTSPFDYAERAEDRTRLMLAKSAPPLDQHGMVVEEFGQIDNLMIESAIHEAGGTVLRIEKIDARAETRAFGLFNADLFRKAAIAWLERFRQH